MSAAPRCSYHRPPLLDMFRGLRRQSVVIASLLVAPFILAAQRRPNEEMRPSTIPTDSTVYSPLRWRHVGPEGNRVTSVTGVSGAPNVYYAVAASGGIFKTTDGGLHWKPIAATFPP